MTVPVTRRVDHGGHAALLVGGAAAPHLAVADVAVVRLEGPVGAVAHVDGVDVGVHGDDVLAAADAADDAAQAVDPHFVEADLAHLRADPLDHPLLLPGEGRDGDDVGEELGDVVAVTLGQGENRIAHDRLRGLHPSEGLPGRPERGGAAECPRAGVARSSRPKVRRSCTIFASFVPRRGDVRRVEKCGSIMWRWRRWLRFCC
jgi:hypothetical protein